MSPDETWGALRAEQDDAIERADYLSDARARRARSQPPPPAIRWRWALSAAAAVLVAGTAGWRVSSAVRGPKDLRFVVGPDGETGEVGAWIAASSGAALPLQFSDGTVVSLSAGARARVSAVDANGARIVIERGRANASVVHRAASHWLVDVGPFAVTVVGTRFDVSWDADDEVFQLRLLEGSVLVAGPCLREPRQLVQGHLLRVLCKGGSEEMVETRADASDTEMHGAAPSGLGGELARAGANTGAGDASDRGAETLPKTVTQADEPLRGYVGANAPPEPRLASAKREPAVHRADTDVLRSDAWRTLTSAGRYRDALDLVERSGFELQCGKASGTELLELGDVARFAGSSVRAREAYAAARSQLPGGGRSTYGLGLTAFDRDKDFALAARWFEVYLAEQRHGELRREAEGRLMEAWQRAGDQERARRAAKQYLRDYPDGTQAPLARELATP